MLTDTATSLLEFVSETQPMCEASQLAAIALSLKHIQQARHQRVADLRFTTCLAALSHLVSVAHIRAYYAPACCPIGAEVRTQVLYPGTQL